MRSNDPLRLAGATAFFTTFALPPILIILFQLFGLFVGQRMMGAELRDLLVDTFGPGVASQMRQTTRGFRTLSNNWYTTVLGFVFLLFVSTTLFTVVKNTLNDIWNIKLKEKQGFLFSLATRAKSLAIIVAAGLLFIASILMDGFELLAGKNISKIWEGGGRFFESALNEVLGVVVVTAWFIILFRYVADGRPSWRASLRGGFLTGVLFSIGKTILSYLIKHSNINNLYGASASFVFILLFVFYSSFILYFGASFIQVYSERRRTPVKPLPRAYKYRLQELD